MAREVTDFELELVEDVFEMGGRWLVRQPNGDLVAFRYRPVRQEPSNKKSPWIVKRGGTIKATDMPIIVSKEAEDLARIHKTAEQPSCILELSIKHGLNHLWNERVTM